MEKHPQDQFFQLAIVRSAGQKLRPLPVGPRWWGPPSPRRITFPGTPFSGQDLRSDLKMHANLVCMLPAALPAMRHYTLLIVLRRIRRFLRRSFANKATVGLHAPSAVLAFRRPKKFLFSQAETDGSMGRKMPSGSVGCAIAHATTSNEGGKTIAHW